MRAGGSPGDGALELDSVGSKSITSLHPVFEVPGRGEQPGATQSIRWVHGQEARLGASREGNPWGGSVGSMAMLLQGILQKA